MPRTGYIVLSASFLLLLFACKTRMTQFVISYEALFGKPAVSGNTVSFSTPVMKTDCRVRFEKNNTKRSKVRKVLLKSIDIRFNSEANAALLDGRLKSIYISSPSYAEHKITFRKLEVHTSGRQMSAELQGTDDDLINFIRQDRFSLRCEFVQPEKLHEDLEMQATIGFFVEGELIKTILYQKILV